MLPVWHYEAFYRMEIKLAKIKYTHEFIDSQRESFVLAVFSWSTLLYQPQDSSCLNKTNAPVDKR